MARNLKGHAPREAVHPKYDSRPVARTVTTHVMDAYLTLLPLRQLPYPSAQQQLTRLAISCAPTLCPSLSPGKRRAFKPLLQPI
jgi:hypothetical protein